MVTKLAAIVPRKYIYSSWRAACTWQSVLGSCPSILNQPKRSKLVLRTHVKQTAESFSMLYGASLTGRLTRSHSCGQYLRPHKSCLLNPYLYYHNRTFRRCLLTLAIETSCDDTCVAILDLDAGTDKRDDQQNMSKHGKSSQNDARPESGHQMKPGLPGIVTNTRLLFNEKVTAKNTGHGGIHPLEALDSHRANLAKLVEKALLSLPVVGSSPTSLSSRPATTTAAAAATSDMVDGFDALSNTEAKEKFVIQGRDGRTRKRPDFIAATRGPGMRSNLSCGLEVAKGLAVAWQVPLVGVHHMQAHALTPRLLNALEVRDRTQDATPSTDRALQCPRPAFPFLTLLVSGGHTMLLHSVGLTEHEILASTADVAIGDALDKCGRLLLPIKTKTTAKDTAFGKYLSEYAFPDRSSFNLWPLAERRRDEVAKPVNKFGWQMQTPFSNTRDPIFSFTSIATRAESLLRERELALGVPISEEERMALARTVIGTAFEHLASRTIIALENLKRKQIHISSLVVSGGVAANDFLRHYLRAMLTVRGFDDVEIIFPPPEYCTDNAAMIAWAGVEMYSSGYSSDLGIAALRKWSMDGDSSGGGILGATGWNFRGSTFKLSNPVL